MFLTYMPSSILIDVEFIEIFYGNEIIQNMITYS